ncbi:hypothetical protein [Micromonospora aurantiaca (nom. illeg.)]|uniref:hypothetical protein n=1 Tax=Micromonospora aurantiaca (nom. illeg.) TaxID=47850 RepID=UPI0036B4EB74
MALSPERVRARARYAGKRRMYPDRPEMWVDHLREVRYLAAEHYIRQLVDAFPTPTPEQRARLAALLAPAGGDK